MAPWSGFGNFAGAEDLIRRREFVAAPLKEESLFCIKRRLLVKLDLYEAAAAARRLRAFVREIFVKLYEGAGADSGETVRGKIMGSVRRRTNLMTFGYCWWRRVFRELVGIVNKLSFIRFTSCATGGLV